MRQIQIVMLSPAELRENVDNPQIHPNKQLRQIVRSIETNGFYNPAILDELLRIIAGHGRVAAAKKLGLTSIPCIILEGLTETQKRAIMLADNKIAANATTDRSKLRKVLSEILEIDVTYDLTLTGYAPVEIDEVMLEISPEDVSPSPKDERVPDLRRDSPPVTQTADLWICGDHRIVQGNSLETAPYTRVLGSELAQQVLTDPPWNLRSREIGGAGSIKHGDFVMAAGEMSEAAYSEFLLTACIRLAEFSAPGCLHFIFVDWKHVDQLIAAGKAAFTEMKNLIVWAKHTGGMGAFYRSRHELICVFKHGTAPHINNFGLGKGGRNRTNVWEYRGLNSGGTSRLEELAMHPTVKPVRMLADAMQDCSQKGGVILDNFGGSGSTVIAAQKTGRRARLIELDPYYVDCAVRRWQAFTKDDAVNALTGETFDEQEARLRLATCQAPLADPALPGGATTEGDL